MMDGQSSKTKRMNKFNETKTTRYSDNKTIMGDWKRCKIGRLGGSLQAK